MTAPQPGPRTRVIAPFTVHVFNRISRRFAGWLPGFALVRHVGRRTGRIRETPVNIFRAGERYVIALTYGSDVQWLRNVFAAGGCELKMRGRTVRVGEPELVVDPRRRLMPQPVRAFLGLLRVREFLLLRPVDADVGRRPPALRRRRRR